VRAVLMHYLAVFDRRTPAAFQFRDEHALNCPSIWKYLIV
jgi:hypothetical protein